MRTLPPASANRLRGGLIGVLAAAAVVSVVAEKRDSPFLGWFSFVLFLLAVSLYFAWRRAVRAKVFDREAKTRDATRSRPDQ